MKIAVFFICENVLALNNFFVSGVRLQQTITKSDSFKRVPNSTHSASTGSSRAPRLEEYKNLETPKGFNIWSRVVPIRPIPTMPTVENSKPEPHNHRGFQELHSPHLTAFTAKQC